jgi:hypothetical protein
VIKTVQILLPHWMRSVSSFPKAGHRAILTDWMQMEMVMPASGALKYDGSSEMQHDRQFHQCRAIRQDDQVADRDATLVRGAELIPLRRAETGIMAGVRVSQFLLKKLLQCHFRNRLAEKEFYEKFSHHETSSSSMPG